MNKLELYISPCPNDTFIFGPLVSGKIEHDYDIHVHLEDIEKLNEIAKNENPDLIKVSAAMYPHLKKYYFLQESGSALGKGVGPLLISKTGEEDFNSVAIPGKHTTAYFLFRSAYPDYQGKIVELSFSDIEDAVINGKVDAGVIIHENRFTYLDKGLKLITDLGEEWEDTWDMPIPLGLIMANRLRMKEDEAENLSKLIRQSLDYAWEQYPKLDDFVTSNAQEMSEDVMRQHINLYVNEYTMFLGDEGHKAIYKMEDCIDKGV